MLVYNNLDRVIIVWHIRCVIHEKENNISVYIQCVPEKTKPRIIDVLSYLNHIYN